MAFAKNCAFFHLRENNDGKIIIYEILSWDEKKMPEFLLDKRWTLQAMKIAKHSIEM